MFEYDTDKSNKNKERHGIDFEEAKELWDSTHVILPAKNVLGEERFVILGKIKGKHYVAIYTVRGRKTRIISCHRADRKWENIYEKYTRREA